jgi:hypothetical protein
VKPAALAFFGVWVIFQAARGPLAQKLLGLTGGPAAPAAPVPDPGQQFTGPSTPLPTPGSSVPGPFGFTPGTGGRG